MPSDQLRLADLACADQHLWDKGQGNRDRQAGLIDERRGQAGVLDKTLAGLERSFGIISYIVLIFSIGRKIWH